jgi:hypothetical protein
VKLKELFRRQWAYKAIGDKEQQTMTSIGVKLLQRIVSLGVWFSHCLMDILLLTLYGNNEQDCLAVGRRNLEYLVTQLGIVNYGNNINGDNSHRTLTIALLRLPTTGRLAQRLNTYLMDWAMIRYSCFVNYSSWCWCNDIVHKDEHC